ncbi:Histone deacetylase-like amidohydrolase [compost metagenome]
MVFIHEGGYSEAYVPFCGLAVMEQLSGVHTGVVDPLLDWVTQQQPGAEAAAFLADRVRQLANLINK